MSSFEATDDPLREVRAMFVERLPTRVETIEQLAARVLSDDASNAERRDLHRAAHSLVGVGASVGFTELGLTARALEEALDPALDGGAADRELLTRCVAALRRTADAVLLREAPPRETTVR